MCLASAPSTPTPPALPPAPPPAPTPADPAVAVAKQKARAQSALAAGYAGDIATSPQGDLTTASTTRKTALGQ